MFDFSDKAFGMIRRNIRSVAWHPELELPDMSPEAVLGMAEEWLPLYAGNARSVQELKKIDMCEVTWGLLSYEREQEVERLAPEYVTVPTVTLYPSGIPARGGCPHSACASAGMFRASGHAEGG